MKKRLAIAIFGPTASGKTSLSIELGLKLRENLGAQPAIISADSRQIYKYLDVGTSKITTDEMRGIPHLMLDIADPVRKFELESYSATARSALEECFASGQLPLLVGGTGTYIKSVVEGWELKGDAALRRSLVQDFPPHDREAAYSMLERLNPAAALPIHKNNYEAVINALVQYFHGGDSTLNNPPAPLIKWIMLRCDQPQTRLESRISQVLDEQYRHGLIEEVHWLNHHYDLHNEMRRRGQRSSNQVLHTHGYREFFELAGERSRGVESLGKADLQRVREQTLEHIVRYSRHQRSWFNKFPGTRITGLEDAYRVVGRAIDKFGPFKMHS